MGGASVIRKQIGANQSNGMRKLVHSNESMAIVRVFCALLADVFDNQVREARAAVGEANCRCARRRFSTRGYGPDLYPAWSQAYMDRSNYFRIAKTR